MYINPCVAGVLSTLLAELGIVVIAAVVAYKNKNK